MHVNQIEVRREVLKELSGVLQQYNQDVCNIWFTLDTDPSCNPSTGLCFQTNRIFYDLEHDERILDEFITEVPNSTGTEETSPDTDIQSSVPQLFDEDMIAGFPHDGKTEVEVMFRSMWYTHRSCEYRHLTSRDGDECSKPIQRRNNMEARFLMLDEGGLAALSQWVIDLKHRVCQGT